LLKSFPIHAVLSEIKKELTLNTTVLLQASPGAGKSTILPLELLNEYWLKGKKILLLEPRRIAARMVAERMANLLNENIGETIGYRIRFENKTSNKTKIEVVTEGILTRMLQNDATLENVALVVFDEFHERSIHADLSLALCRNIQQVLRHDLKILIMSATLEVEKISKILNNSPVIKSEGRQYPVKIIYAPDDTKDWLTKKIVRLISRAAKEQSGDILVFIPGASEILQIKELLEKNNIESQIFTLYGDLPFHLQQKAILFEENSKRKIILSTSIAETSLTIEGITTVVDCGYSRTPHFNPNSGLTKLQTTTITKDTAEQRAGRAGRLGPGVCYRLWSEASHLHLIAERRPEILESDLAPLMLELFKWGIKNIEELNWITLPNKGNIEQATELLGNLQAIENLKITEKGKAMLLMPAHPRLAHMIFENKNNLPLVSDLISALDEKDPFNLIEKNIDITTRIIALRKYRLGEKINADRNVLERMEKIANQWRKLLGCREENFTVNNYLTGKILACAYPDRIAKQVSKNNCTYRLCKGKHVKISENDILINEEWLVVANADAGSKEGKVFLAAPIDINEMEHLIKEKNIVEWDDAKETVVAYTEKYIGEIAVGNIQNRTITDEERIQTICKTIRKKSLSFINWDEKEINWQNRILSLRKWNTAANDIDWPIFNNESLILNLEEWLGPYLNGIRKKTELQSLNKIVMLTAFLGWEKAELLEKLAPEKIKVPSDSLIELNYFAEGKSPALHVRLQEVFGMMETPTINNGRTKITIHLLSPGYKPVQVTQDLKSFWTNTYQEVRKDLQRRYPKHAWPENPFTAKAVKGAIKRKYK
jgi:ATP-dependent helicase HrpB